jgi:hypothetical protein
MASPEYAAVAHDVKRTAPMLLGDYNSAGRILMLPLLAFILGIPGHCLWAAEPSGPAAIYAGPVAITPTLNMNLTWRDNIYLQEDETTDSWIFSMNPAVTAQMQDRDRVYRLTYEGAKSWYKEDSSNDRNNFFDHTLTGDALVPLTDSWTSNAYMSRAWLHEDRGTGLTEGQIGTFISEPVEYEQTDVGGSLDYSSGIGGLTLRGSFTDREYQNFRELTRSRDTETISVGAKLSYPIAPKTDIFLDYGHNDIKYPNPFEQVPPLDSYENSLEAGVSWEITPNLTSSAQAGYTEKKFDDPDRRDWDGLSWSLSLVMQPREQDTITVTGSRAPDETTLQGDFIKRETLTTTWSHNWSDRVDTSLSGTVTRETYENSANDRKDYVYGVSVSTSYQFRRWASITASYSYADKDSNADNLSYRQNTVTIGVNLSL